MSSTFLVSRTAWEVVYGTGQVAGVLAKDTISMGGLTLRNHTFGVTLQQSVEFSGADVQFDGLVGTAQSRLSNQGVLTPVEALREAGAISSATVSYALGRVDDDTNVGQITFGGIDTSKFEGELVSFPNECASARERLSLTIAAQDGFWVRSPRLDRTDACRRARSCALARRQR